MPVFRIEKTKNYTVMSNHHLRDKKLSLKAKGLLSLLLSLPETWEHSIAGYAAICKDGVDGITTAIKELEKSGYITRKRLRNEKGYFSDTEYTIFESPRQLPKQDKPILENPILDSPVLDKPMLDTPNWENPVQYNTNLSNNDLISTDAINPYPINQKEQKPQGYEMIGFKTYKELKETVYENIEYNHFMKHGETGVAEKVTEIAELIIETLCSTKPYINIAGDNFPAELVKERMLKIGSQHIQYVLHCFDDAQVDIKNIKRYLLAAIFNSPSTIDNFYSAKVKYNLGI